MPQDLDGPADDPNDDDVDDDEDVACNLGDEDEETNPVEEKAVFALSSFD